MSSPIGTTEARALELLGLGTSPTHVAAALGVSEGRISQLLSTEEFASRVAEARYKNLLNTTTRDNVADRIEDKILAKLDSAVDMAFQPLVLAKLYQIVNSAKRRGQINPEQSAAGKTVVNIDMPARILQQFNVNINNQVVSAGERDLNTIQPAALLSKVKGANDAKLNAGR